MTLLYPGWLILIIPMIAVFLIWPIASRLLFWLRITIVALIIFAIATPAIKLPDHSGLVVVVADRSKSMPPDTSIEQANSIRLLHQSMPDNCKLAVVSFAEKASLEHQPRQSEFGGFNTIHSADNSNLAAGLDMAMSMIDSQTPARIIVMSDGLVPVEPLDELAAKAATANIAVDYRYFDKDDSNDLAVVKLSAPDSVGPKNAFMINAWIKSPQKQVAEYSLCRGSTVVRKGHVQLYPGVNRLILRDIAAADGNMGYRLKLKGESKDPVPQNNSAKFIVAVDTPKPVLHIRGQTSSNLPATLTAGGVNIRSVKPENFDFSLENLSGYSSVILENVRSNALGLTGMENIASLVKDSSLGLMMTGGRNSFGAGGYYLSPIEDVLPVSLELRKEHRKCSVAIAVALDRSGSMACPAGGGKTKMDLADLAAAEVVNMLTPMDEFSCIAVDSAPHVIVPMMPMQNKDAIRSKVLRIESMGGGIYVYEALKEAVRQLEKAKANMKHIILFADAADAEQPGKYKELLAYCRKMGITCSVIGLGSAKDPDADFLRDVAKLGRGRCFFSMNPGELPRLFAQDTIVVSKSSFSEEPVAGQFKATMKLITPMGIPQKFSIGGYNVSYLKPDAMLSAATLDKYRSPICAQWQIGLGRAIVWTGQVDGKFTGKIGSSDYFGGLLTSMVRWLTPAKSQLPGGAVVTQKTEKGQCIISLHLDPNEPDAFLTKPPVVTALFSSRGTSPQTRKIKMQWHSPSELRATISLDGSKVMLPTVDIPGQKQLQLWPTCLPYSPEYRPTVNRNGQEILQTLAKATGGKERIDMADIWEELPSKMSWCELSHVFYLMAATIFLLEILQRRTGVISLGLSWLVGRKKQKNVEEQKDEKIDSSKKPTKLKKVKVPKKAKKTDAEKAAKKEGKPSKLEQPETPSNSLADALSKAKNRSNRRM